MKEICFNFCILLLKKKNMYFCSINFDPDFGREFYISGSHNGCDSSGWIMISTSNKCQIENGNKSAFYYAPGQNQATLKNFSIYLMCYLFYRCSVQPGQVIVASTSLILNSDNIEFSLKWRIQNSFIQFLLSSETLNLLIIKKEKNLPQNSFFIHPHNFSISGFNYTFDFHCELFLYTSPDSPVYPTKSGSSKYIMNIQVMVGSLYKQGETWLDGCDYNCSCDNAQTGFYTCKPLCPVYSNLPVRCVVDKSKGGCCGKVVCTGIAGFFTAPPKKWYFPHKVIKFVND
ncbi:hypothetical protein KUTeg_019125 [Tegillarca granosa]|uniref:VWFD domain-containing protein n=1 Tax=Tegillarca granosa TaxID=220873 RepID=A0ABQ9EDQ2_TEGGR|nr:hypothetical protein KUTeg_019125 [Tegillarca granosa]